MKQVIAPGIRTSAQALWGEADMLPAIEIKKPASILAKETISAMQGGLVYGQIGQTEYIINQLKKESGYENAKVVATGGLGKIIAAETESIYPRTNGGGYRPALPFALQRAGGRAFMYGDDQCKSTAI